MYSEVKNNADRLISEHVPEMFIGRKIGLEKESLRVTAAGSISQSDHPQSLGRALTHPNITTDFSEALLEMVTPPCDCAEASMHYLNAIHQFIARRLPDGEHLWNTSMPCILHGGDSVRIGQYGHSHNGQMKHAYRRGLGLRYGRRMQAIAGVHFNFSFPDTAWPTRSRLHSESAAQASRRPWPSVPEQQQQQARTQGYFETLQNLLRVGWMVPYLFGASPAVCASFLKPGEGEGLELWNQSSYFAPYGTSLRMSKIGYRYRDDQPIDLGVRHTAFDEYVSDILAHVTSEHEPYKVLGVRDADGNYQQLSAARLQIENEYYSSVRPKQIPRRGEFPIHALEERGIAYLELRSVDVNPFEPNGLSLYQVAMLELLMMFAWLCPPRPLGADEVDLCSQNMKRVAAEGRKPGLQLQRLTASMTTESVDLQQWGRSILDTLTPIAAWLDAERTSALYMPALQAQYACFDNAELTPSAQALDGMKKTGSFFENIRALSKAHHEHFLSDPEDASLQQSLLERVHESVTRQTVMEDASEGSFSDYLETYFSQIRPEPARV